MVRSAPNWRSQNTVSRVDGWNSLNHLKYPTAGWLWNNGSLTYIGIATNPFRTSAHHPWDGMGVFFMAQILCKMQKKLFKHPSRLLYLRLETGQLAHTPQNNQIHLQFLLSLARKKMDHGIPMVVLKCSGNTWTWLCGCRSPRCIVVRSFSFQTFLQDPIFGVRTTLAEVSIECAMDKGTAGTAGTQHIWDAHPSGPPKWPQFHQENDNEPIDGIYGMGYFEFDEMVKRWMRIIPTLGMPVSFLVENHHDLRLRKETFKVVAPLVSKQRGGVKYVFFNPSWRWSRMISIFPGFSPTNQETFFLRFPCLVSSNFTGFFGPLARCGTVRHLLPTTISASTLGSFGSP